MQQLSGYGLLVLELAVALSGAQDSVDSSLGTTSDTDVVKRGGQDWTSLRGSWGKREEPSQDIDLQNLEDKRGWEAFHGSWGKRSADWSNFRGSWGKRDVTESLLGELEKRAAQWNNFRGSWGKRNNWSNLRGAWGKRSSEEAVDDEVVSSDEVDGVDTLEEAPVKRAWQKIFGSSPWLKRPDVRSMSPRSTNWSSLRGAWGKRGGPNNNWSNLRGAWGKRGGNGDWNSFRGSWGKRGNGAGDWSNFRGSWGKRGAPTDWSSFRGSWGKRDALDEPDASIQ